MTRPTHDAVSSDIAALGEAIVKLGPIVRSTDPIWNKPPALKVLDCVLSLNRRYDDFVFPRLAAFSRQHPDIQTLEELVRVIDSYPSPAAFATEALNYKDPRRARTLRAVVEWLRSVVSASKTQDEERALANWATDARPSDYIEAAVAGFGLAGFQYLRMLFGANTTKPDVHVRRFIAEVLGRSVSDVEALSLLERAGRHLQLPVRDIDTTVWTSRARAR